MPFIRKKTLCAVLGFALAGLIGLVGLVDSQTLAATPQFVIGTIRLIKSPTGQIELAMRIKNEANYPASHLFVNIQCASVFPKRISQYADLTNAQRITTPGYIGPAPGWSLDKGKEQEFVIEAPYLSKPESCQAEVVGAANALRETE